MTLGLALPPLALLARCALADPELPVIARRAARLARVLVKLPAEPAAASAAAAAAARRVMSCEKTLDGYLCALLVQTITSRVGVSVFVE